MIRSPVAVGRNPPPRRRRPRRAALAGAAAACLLRAGWRHRDSLREHRRRRTRWPRCVSRRASPTANSSPIDGARLPLRKWLPRGRCQGGHPGAARVWRLQQRVRDAGADLGGTRHRHLCLRPARLWRRARPRLVGRARGGSPPTPSPRAGSCAGPIPAGRSICLAKAWAARSRCWRRPEGGAGPAAMPAAAPDGVILSAPGGLGPRDDGFPAADRAVCRGPAVSGHVPDRPRAAHHGLRQHPDAEGAGEGPDGAQGSARRHGLRAGRSDGRRARRGAAPDGADALDVRRA